MDEKEVETREFTVSLRGYDRDEVDAYLAEIAEEMRQLRAVAGGAPIPQASGSGEAYRQVGDETSKILVAADEAGRDIKDRAQKEATSIVAEARSKAEGITRQHQADRRGFEEEIRHLREARDTLATQLEDVGRRLQETIARLRTPIETPIPPVDRPPEQPKAAEPVKPKVEPPSTPALKTEAPPTPKAEAQPAPKVEAPPAPPAPKAQAPPGAAPKAAVTEAPPKTEASPTRRESRESKALMEKLHEPPAAPEAEETQSATKALADLLGEVRRDREESRRQVDDALSGAPAGRPAGSPTDSSAIQARDDAIGGAPATAGRRLKRLLQEDQNYLLDRLRTHRGKGSFDDSVSPADVQLERFSAGMSDVLSEAFLAGWRGSGASETGEPTNSVAELIQKQIVQPLRRDLGRIVDAGLAAGDTPKAIAERASDVFRVWKGVRTELLGEGLVFAAYNQGLIDALKLRRGTKKAWVASDTEQDCPREVCRSNAEAGSIDLTSTFPSGHQTPPAHGGCNCTLTEG